MLNWLQQWSLAVCLLVFSFLHAFACSQAQSANVSQAVVRIAAGDLIDVQVFNTPELSSKLRVSPDGLITLAGAGEIKVGGLTPIEADAQIEKSLRDSQIMLDPHVTALVMEYSTQGISVLGEVRRPGTYTLLGRHFLYDALSAAGGVTEDQGSSIQVIHQGDPLNPVTVPVNSHNYSNLQRLTEVRAGDTIVVSRADPIYVVGDVVRPGEYLLRSGRQMTILNAIALAQGVNPTAKMTKASIVRKTATGAETIPVDLKKIAQVNGENLVLRPDDVLVIPRSGAKSFVNLALPGVAGAVAGSVAAALILH